MVGAWAAIALEVVLLIKQRIVRRLHGATTRGGKVVAVLALWVVAIGSKLVVLGLVDLIFGDTVSPGGFLSVTLLVVVLLAARSAVRLLRRDLDLLRVDRGAPRRRVAGRGR